MAPVRQPLVDAPAPGGRAHALRALAAAPLAQEQLAAAALAPLGLLALPPGAAALGGPAGARRAYTLCSGPPVVLSGISGRVTLSSFAGARAAAHRRAAHAACHCRNRYMLTP